MMKDLEKGLIIKIE